MQKALFWKKLKDKTAQCQLCPNFCAIKENEIGKCFARKNLKGILYSLTYGKPVAINIDPIEKKPLYHFLPGSGSLSIGTAGCNLHCLHCQNWDISQSSPENFPTQFVSPEKIVELAVRNNCPSISYTYNDPTVFFEYALDIMRLARQRGIKNVWVHNGYINIEPLKKACRYMDAVNIDVKGFTGNFYKKVCCAKLEPVLEAIEFLHRKKVWIELTNLVIPGLNDKEKEVKKMIGWIANLDKNIPLHFSAFHPSHKLINKESTSSHLLANFRKLALKKLNYVYTGNVYDLEGSTTFCPNCKKALIKRAGLGVTENKLVNGKCACGQKISGVW